MLRDLRYRSWCLYQGCHLHVLTNRQYFSIFLALPRRYWNFRILLKYTHTRTHTHTHTHIYIYIYATCMQYMTLQYTTTSIELGNLRWFDYKLIGIFAVLHLAIHVHRVRIIPLNALENKHNKWRAHLAVCKFHFIRTVDAQGLYVCTITWFSRVLSKIMTGLHPTAYLR